MIVSENSTLRTLFGIESKWEEDGENRILSNTKILYSDTSANEDNSFRDHIR
jgi:hypothetical protein